MCKPMMAQKQIYKPELDKILETLNEVALATSNSTELKQVLPQVLEIVVQKSHSQSGIIFYYVQAESRFEQTATYGLSDEDVKKIENHRYNYPQWDPVQEVASTGEVIFIPDITQHPGFSLLQGNLSEHHSLVNIPLKSRGALNGVMALIDLPGNPASHSDVLELIGHQIGLLIENLMLLAEANQRQKEASLLYHLGTQISSSLNFRQTIQAIAAGARQLGSAETGFVGLLDGDQGVIQAAAVDGKNSAALENLRLSLRAPFPGPNPNLWQTVIIRDLVKETPIQFDAAPLLEVGVRSLIVAPLIRGKRLHGIVAVLDFWPRSYPPDLYKLIRYLGNQAVIAIENAHLYQEVHSLATIEERQRLAREIHDEAAQALALVHLEVSTSYDALAQGKVEQAQTSLLELKEHVKNAYTDMREAIFNLRTSFTPDDEYGNSLREYLALYRSYYGVNAQLEYDDPMIINRLTSEQKVQINRIIQEALSNARKHSSASNVFISFQDFNDKISIQIRDDGCGFDPSQTVPSEYPHFGIQIMHERALSIHAQLQITSQNGQGTCVCLLVPVQTKGV